MEKEWDYNRVNVIRKGIYIGGVIMVIDKVLNYIFVICIVDLIYY